MWLLSSSEAKLESQPAPILRCHCTTLWSLTFEESKSHGVRASASCTASALGVFVPQTFAANQRCHSWGIRGPGAGCCFGLWDFSTFSKSRTPLESSPPFVPLATALVVTIWCILQILLIEIYMFTMYRVDMSALEDTRVLFEHLVACQLDIHK